MDKFEKEKSLTTGKGENDEIKWITANGSHIPIGKGETPKQAVEKRFGEKKTMKNKKQTLEEQVNAVLDGTYKGRHITICEETPKIFQEVGVPNLPFLMTSKHAYLAINKDGKYKGENDHYHDLGRELFVLIPKLLQSPTLLLQSPKDKNELLAILSWYDKDKNILICPIKLNGKGYQNYIEIDANITKSVYGRPNLQNYINKNFTQNDILAFDNKKIRDLTI